MPRPLRFTFLGRVALEPPERLTPVEVRGTQPALVLAYLVLERPRPLLRDDLVDVRLFQHRAGEVVEMLRTAADDQPQIPAYRAALALCCAESGDLAGAAAAYGYFAAVGFELPADSNWLLAVAVLADTCVTLGDADGGAVLGRLLEPWADRHVILNCYGGGGAYWGPVAHHLGRLALLRHDRCRGEELFRRAVELSECARAPQFVARSRAELARLG